MDTIQKDSKRPLYMACSICGKEIMLHEGYDYCQSRRRTMVYCTKAAIRKREKKTMEEVMTSKQLEKIRKIAGITDMNPKAVSASKKWPS